MCVPLPVTAPRRPSRLAWKVTKPTTALRSTISKSLQSLQSIHRVFLEWEKACIRWEYTSLLGSLSFRRRGAKRCGTTTGHSHTPPTKQAEHVYFVLPRRYFKLQPKIKTHQMLACWGAHTVPGFRFLRLYPASDLGPFHRICHRLPTAQPATRSDKHSYLKAFLTSAYISDLFPRKA